MDTLIPIVFLVAVAYVVVAVTRLITTTIVRLRLVKAGATSELAASLAGPPDRRQTLDSALQWGLAAAGVGLGFVVIQFIPFGEDEPISIGIILLFAAAGLLAYHAASGRLREARG
jgi:phosphatidylglycerophosphate synthase